MGCMSLCLLPALSRSGTTTALTDDGKLWSLVSMVVTVSAWQKHAKNSFNFFDPAVPHEVPDFWYWADGDPEWGDWTRPQSGAVMPRDASRITLEVTGVRVERLQSADESNLLNDLGDMLENCDTVAGRAFNHAEHYAIAGVPVGLCPEMHGFKAWWDKANGAGSFDSNPWVWVIEFKRIEGGEA
jgi:hypothetical protein